MTEGLKDGREVVGNAVGVGEGISVGWDDNGVGSSVVGSNVGLGVGIVEGNVVGDGVGMIVGDGVVGEGVIKFVGKEVGDGVGVQVLQPNVRMMSTPPVGNRYPFVNILQIFSPIGGLKAYRSPCSSANAKSCPWVITQYFSYAALSVQ